MMTVRLYRLGQIAKYGWRDSKSISKEYGKNRFLVFFDILWCYLHYGIWSNQYKTNCFWKLSSQERKTLGEKFGNANKSKDEWLSDFYENRKFLRKYSNYRYEVTPQRHNKRREAYKQRYNMGENCTLQFDVEISRMHYLNGTIKIGYNVLLAKHVFVDYSGNVRIGNNVQLANGVIIETHYHPGHSDYKMDIGTANPTDLVVCDGAFLGSRAIILSSCHYIGENARVAAGSVVTHDVPDYAVVAGVPAKVIRYMERE